MLPVFGEKKKTVKESNPTQQHKPAHNLIKQEKEKIMSYLSMQ